MERSAFQIYRTLRAHIGGPGPYKSFQSFARRRTGRVPVPKTTMGTTKRCQCEHREIVWQKPVGNAMGLPKAHAILACPNGSAGPTATAGGLLFYAGVSDGRLRAFNSLNGEELWSNRSRLYVIVATGKLSNADGRQYVSITVAGEIRAYALSP